MLKGGAPDSNSGSEEAVEVDTDIGNSADGNTSKNQQNAKLCIPRIPDVVKNNF